MTAADIPDAELDPLVHFFLWAAEKGYSQTATEQEGGLMAMAFVAGWHAARDAAS